MASFNDLEKIVCLGACGVGKTSLIERIRSGNSVRTTSTIDGQDGVSTYIPTTESVWTHTIALPGGKSSATVELVDTTGAQTSLGDEIRNMHTVFGNAFIVVFSVNDRSSFVVAKEMLKKVIEVKKGLQRHEHVPLLLLGTFAGESEQEREVSALEGKKLAGSYWDCTYRETSNLFCDDLRLMDGWLLNEVVLRPTGKSKQRRRLASSLKAWVGKVHDMVNPASILRKPLPIAEHAHAHGEETTRQAQAPVARSQSRQQMFFKLMSAHVRRQMSVHG